MYSFRTYETGKEWITNSGDLSSFLKKYALAVMPRGISRTESTAQENRISVTGSPRVVITFYAI